MGDHKDSRHNGDDGEGVDLLLLDLDSVSLYPVVYSGQDNFSRQRENYRQFKIINTLAILKIIISSSSITI